MWLKKKDGKWHVFKILGMGFILFIAVFFLYQDGILRAIGNNLVKQDFLQPADAIVVLAGSFSGNRMREAVDLMQKGYGRFILFSGVQVYPGVYTHSFMKKYAIQLGIPEKKILTQVLTKERSTLGEAIENIKGLHTHGLKSMILVTSAYHTKRSHAVYQRLIDSGGKDIQLMVHPAVDPDIPIEAWWKTRLGVKQIFLEYFKLIFYSGYELNTV